MDFYINVLSLIGSNEMAPVTVSMQTHFPVLLISYYPLSRQFHIITQLVDI